jgi:hypothetical protein
LCREPIFDDDKPARVGSDVAYLPDGLIDRYSGNHVIDAALLPAFAALWKTAGEPCAAWFNAEGKWHEPPPDWHV